MMRDEKKSKRTWSKISFWNGFCIAIVCSLGSKVGLPAVLGVPFDPCRGFSVANRKRGVQHFP